MNWTDLAAIATIVALCITAATVYLRLFVAAKLAEHERRQNKWLDDNYHSKPIIDLRFENLESRVARLETSHE